MTRAGQGEKRIPGWPPPLVDNLSENPGSAWRGRNMVGSSVHIRPLGWPGLDRAVSLSLSVLSHVGSVKFPVLCVVCNLLF